MKLTTIAEQLANYHVALEPDENTPEWWAGAPSAAIGPDGTFYLAARMREGNSPRGRRGYEIRILKSGDGLHFAPINHITREAAGLIGFERPALVVDPATNLFRLYGCANLETGWGIIKWDDVADPAQINAASAKVLVRGEEALPHFAHVSGHKDPVVFHDRGVWHLFTIGSDFIERIHHFTSPDGLQWEKKPGTVLENAGWHDFYTRPASILPMDIGYLFVYEGSYHDWRDPVYNIATGLAYTPDLEHFIDLTPEKPLLTSTTPGNYHTWRYSHWLKTADALFVYFEAARPNNTNELRAAHITFLSK